MRTRKDKARKKEALYVALDVEAAGPEPAAHSLLSVGACIVPREPLSFEECVSRGLVFYAELKPASLAFNDKGMRIGCSRLECLGPKCSDKRYDPKHAAFDARLVLKHMAEVCEEPALAAASFRKWLGKAGEGRMIIPVTDVVFFDSVYFSNWLGGNGGSPLGYSGRDLKSIYQGYTRRKRARLGEIKVPRNKKPHRADYDAVELAQKAKVLLFDRLGW